MFFFQLMSEEVDEWCWDDIVRQCIPHLSSGNRKQTGPQDCKTVQHSAPPLNKFSSPDIPGYFNPAAPTGGKSRKSLQMSSVVRSLRALGRKENPPPKTSPTDPSPPQSIRVNTELDRKHARKEPRAASVSIQLRYFCRVLSESCVLSCFTAANVNC